MQVKNNQPKIQLSINKIGIKENSLQKVEKVVIIGTRNDVSNKNFEMIRCSCLRKVLLIS